jgi:hypothetical protein
MFAAGTMGLAWLVTQIEHVLQCALPNVENWFVLQVVGINSQGICVVLSFSLIWLLGHPLHLNRHLQDNQITEVESNAFTFTLELKSLCVVLTHHLAPLSF